MAQGWQRSRLVFLKNKPSSSICNESRSPLFDPFPDFPLQPAPDAFSLLVPSHRGALRDSRLGGWFGRFVKLPPTTINWSKIPCGSMVEHHPSSAKEHSGLHQFGRKVVRGVFIGFLLYAGGHLLGRHFSVADVEKKLGD